MPSPVDVEYLDGEFTVSEQEPSTIAEVVELLGEEAVRKSAIDDNRYRNKYPRVYRKVSEEVVKLGFKRGVASTKTNKDGTTKDVLESTNDHIRAYLGGRKDKAGNVLEPAPEGSRELLAELFASIGANEPLYVKGERAGGGGKIAQATLDAANGFIAEGDDRTEEIVSVIESSVPAYKVGRDSDSAVTPESLARGIQTLEKHLQNEAKKKTAGLFAKK